MHPLSLFPGLLNFGFYAPTILRLAVGIFLIYKGKERLSKTYRWAGILYIVVGLLVFVGLYTQLAALIGFFIVGFDDWADKKSGKLTRDSIILHSLCAVVLISLMVSGPGFLAFDLPL